MNNHAYWANVVRERESVALYEIKIKLILLGYPPSAIIQVLWCKDRQAEKLGSTWVRPIAV